MCGSNDYDECAVWREKWLKARKPHKCSECRLEIKRGDLYQYVTSLYEGEWYDHRTCAKCADIWKRFVEYHRSKNEQVFIYVGGLSEAITECRLDHQLVTNEHGEDVELTDQQWVEKYLFTEATK